MLHGGPFDHLRSAANSAAVLAASASVRSECYSVSEFPVFCRPIVETSYRAPPYTGGVIGEMTGPVPVSTFTRVARERLGVRRAIACVREGRP